MYIDKLLSSTAYSPVVFKPEDGQGTPDATPVEAQEEARIDDNPPADPAAQDPAADPQPKPEEDPEIRWRDREINKKHSQLKERERLLAERERELAEARAEAESLRRLADRAAAAQGDDDPRPAPTRKVLTEADVERLAEEKSTAKVFQDKFNQDCNATNSKGVETYGEDKWNEACGRIGLLGPLDNDTLIQVLTTDDPSRVLFELGSNPDEYHRVMSLPPQRRFAEMVKISVKDAPKRRPSDAPDPVEPLRGGGSSVVTNNSIYNDKMSDDDWHRIRDEQRLAYLNKKGGRAA